MIIISTTNHLESCKKRDYGIDTRLSKALIVQWFLKATRVFIDEYKQCSKKKLPKLNKTVERH